MNKSFALRELGNRSSLALLASMNLLLTVAINFGYVAILGPGIETDIIVICLLLPTLFSSLITSPFISIAVPMIVSHRESKKFSQGLFFLAVLISLPVSLTLFFFPTTLLGKIFPTLNSGNPESFINAWKILSFSIISISGNSVLTAVARANGQILKIEAVTFFVNLTGAFLLIYHSQQLSAELAASILLFKYSGTLLFMVFIVGRFGAINLKDDAYFVCWARLKTVLLGGLIYKQSPLLDRFLLSRLTPGSLTVFILAQQIWSSVHAISDRTLISHASKTLSQLAANTNHATFTSIYGKTIFQAVLLGAFALLSFGFGLAFFREEIATFFSTELKGEDLIKTLWGLSLFMFFGCLGQVAALAGYSLNMGNTITKIAIVSFVFSSTFKLFLFNSLGLWSVIIGATLYQGLNFFLINHSVSKKSLLK